MGLSSEQRAAMKKVIIPSMTDDRAVIDARLPCIWEGWKADQPPGNYTCMDVGVEPYAGGWWRIVLYVVEDPV